MEKAKKTDFSKAYSDNDFKKITNMLVFIEGFKKNLKETKLKEKLLSIIYLSKKETDDWSKKDINECINKINNLSEEFFYFHKKIASIRNGIIMNA